MRIHYVMPMAGRGSRFNNHGFGIPKPLIEIYGKPFFYWATKSISKFVELESLDFVVLQEHIVVFGIDEIIKKYFPDARIHALEDVTEGAVITCMQGIKDIEDDLPVVFNDCDHLFKSQVFNEFCWQTDLSCVDGILLTFKADEPIYSFVGKDSTGNVNRTVEKEVISNEAICGCYYFANKHLFLNMAQEYLVKCDYKEYFMSGVYNIMIKHNMHVTSMPTDFHIPFGIPEEYEIALGDKHYEALE